MGLLLEMERMGRKLLQSWENRQGKLEIDSGNNVEKRKPGADMAPLMPSVA